MYCVMLIELQVHRDDFIQRRCYVIKVDFKEIGSGLDLSSKMQGEVARP